MPVETLIVVLVVLAIAAYAVHALAASHARQTGLLEYLLIRGDVYDKDELLSDIFAGIGIAEDAGALGDDELDDKDRR